MTTFDPPQSNPTTPNLQPLHSFMTTSNTAIHFDKQEELIWLGNSSGQIVSMYQTLDPNDNTFQFQTYTAMNLNNSIAAKFDQNLSIHSFASVDKNIIYSTQNCVGMRKKSGVNQWVFHDSVLTANLNSICVSTGGSGSSVEILYWVGFGLEFFWASGLLDF